MVFFKEVKRTEGMYKDKVKTAFEHIEKVTWAGIIITLCNFAMALTWIKTLQSDATNVIGWVCVVVNTFLMIKTSEAVLKYINSQRDMLLVYATMLNNHIVVYKEREEK